MREILASIQHKIWSHWMTYLFSRCFETENGSVIIPAELVQRWKRQASTDYDKLSEEEKEGDREQADKVIATVFEWFKANGIY